MKRTSNLFVPVLCCFLIFSCKKDATKENIPDQDSNVSKNADVLVRKTFTSEELTDNTLSKNAGPDGTALSATSACTGNVYTLSYELTSCSSNQSLNFYVRVGSQLTPQAVKIKVKQRTSGTTFRETTITTPASVTQIATNEWEYKFVLVLSGFNICTEPTTDITLTSSARVRCESDDHGISFTDISTSQQFNLTDYNCRSSYGYSVDTGTPGNATFGLTLLTCGFYGACSIYPSDFAYKYRLKNSGNNWVHVGGLTYPFITTISLPSGTYESYGYTACSGENQVLSPLVEFTVQ